MTEQPTKDEGGLKAGQGQCWTAGQSAREVDERIMYRRRPICCHFCKQLYRKCPEL